MKRPLNPTSRRKRPCRMPRIAAAILLTALTAIAAPKARADEGMWLPSLIGERIDDMRAKGFRLTAEDIYSVNEASMKDAVVLFNGGCTGELISPEGLLVTNHHCGYGAIQGHSTVEHDYLTHGFWARDRSEELPNEGLWVRRLVRMEEVTDRLAAGETAEKICEEAAEKGRYRTAIEQMYYGNQQFLFVYEQFDDVRLVGAPPSSIGKFGGDTDNWMWPRHTGDFSLFRIYADRENRPAKFSRENVPYRPARYFPVSTKGIREGDFTMIYGFPGNTQQYVTADAVAYVVERSDPMKIDLRTRRLEIISAAQEADAATRIRYAAKHASIANAWKKWQGELLGLQRLGTVAQKKAYEAAFARWAADRPEYAHLLDSLRAAYRSATEGYYLQELCNESVKGIELATLAAALKQYAAKPSEALAERIAKLYRDYDPAIDRRMAVEMLRGLEQYYPRPLPEAYTAETTRCKGVEGYAARLFDASAIVRFDAVEPLLRDTAALRAALQREPVLHLVGIFDRGRIPRNLSNLPAVERWYRPYMKALREFDRERPFYPDANLTLRVAYGQVAGYWYADAVYHCPLTTLDGIIAKDDPTVYDYDIPQRLRACHAAKDYGRWSIPTADGGVTVPVCFLATDHTTGGNSGSPVVNADGELVGINFDRTWRSTMSDLQFDPAICRNIAVDIRYVLFTIDRIGGAEYLLKEMELR